MLINLTAIKNAVKASGGHWFDKDTLAFFGSKIDSQYVWPVKGGAYFVSSEKCRWNNGPRLYSVRFCSDAGDIDTVGEFQGYKTAKAAVQAIHEIIKSNPEISVNA